jgi:hypothetical protein
MISYANRALLKLDGVAPLWIDDTVYAPHYSDVGFLSVTPGLSARQLVALVGEPLSMEWRFANRPVSSPVELVRGPGGFSVIGSGCCTEMTAEALQNRFGPPDSEFWRYSERGPTGGFYRIRGVTVSGGVVRARISGYDYD